MININKKIEVDLTIPNNNQRIICLICFSPKFNIFWRHDKNDKTRLPVFDDDNSSVDDPQWYHLENVCERGHKFTNADIMNKEGLFEDAVVKMDVVNT